MIITEIKKKGKNKYQIFVDGAFFAIVLDETILKFHLASGQEFEKEKLLEIVEQGQLPLALDSAFTTLSNYNKTEKEMKENLKQKGFAENIIQKTISKLKENNFINDKRYAEHYVASHKTKGKKAIRFELKNKGVDEKIILEILSNMENQDDIILKLAQKFVKNKKNDEKIREKLYRHLMSKGFSYGEVKKAMDTVLEREDESWD